MINLDWSELDEADIFRDLVLLDHLWLILLKRVLILRFSKARHRSLERELEIVRELLPKSDNFFVSFLVSPWCGHSNFGKQSDFLVGQW